MSLTARVGELPRRRVHRYVHRLPGSNLDFPLAQLPVSSAASMKRYGEMSRWVGCCQRSSASKLTIRRASNYTTG